MQIWILTILLSLDTVVRIN